MRTTLDLDEDLLCEAQRLTGMTGRTAVIHEGLRALIERESARRLARLGATEQPPPGTGAPTPGPRQAQMSPANAVSFAVLGCAGR